MKAACPRQWNPQNAENLFKRQPSGPANVSPIVSACPCLSNLSHAFDPIFFGFSIWIAIFVSPFFKAEICSCDPGMVIYATEHGKK